MYFLAENRVGGIVKYIVQSVTRGNGRELALESTKMSNGDWPQLLRGLVKKKILFEFGKS